jgi:DNA polymerase-3 subunit epsilon
MKVLYFDIEKTGLDPVKNDIIQLAGMVEINGETKEEFFLFSQPFSYENVEQGTLDVHGISIDTIKQFPAPDYLRIRLIKILGKHVDRYNPMDKFYLAGQNIQFDLHFLEENFKKNNDIYFDSWFWRYCLDLYSLSTILRYKGILKTENLKLETLAKHFGIELKARDAMSDIRATREIIRMILDRYIVDPEVENA